MSSLDEVLYATVALFGSNVSPLEVSDQVYTINIYMILLVIIAYEMVVLDIYYTIST